MARTLNSSLSGGLRGDPLCLWCRLAEECMMKQNQFLSLSVVWFLSSCGSEEVVPPVPPPPVPPRPSTPTVDANFHYQSQLMISGASGAAAKCLHVLANKLALSDCSETNRYFEKHLDQTLRTADGDLCVTADQTYQIKMMSCQATDNQRWGFLSDGMIESLWTPGLCVARNQAGDFVLRDCGHVEVVKLGEKNKKVYESYLYNPGPRFRASQTRFAPLSGSVADYRGPKISGTNLSEAHLVGAPANACKDVVINDGTGPIASTDKSCPTFSHEATVGWKVDAQDAYPGYAIWTPSGGSGRPLLFNYLNHALSAPNPCDLREVGLSFRGFEGDAFTQIRPKADGSKKKFGDFTNLMATFTARVQYSQVGSRSNPACASGLAASNVSVDLFLSYERSGQTVRTDVISIIPFYEFEWNPGSPVFWRDGCTGQSCGIGLKADRLGLPRLGDRTQSYTIHYSRIIPSLITSGTYQPPAGFALGDAIIRGFRVISSVRGADLQLQLKGVDLYGFQ